MASQPSEQTLIDLANRLADTSGAVLRRYYRQKIQIHDKADESPVTQADRECEAALRAIINETFPDHGIFGEEFGAERTDAEMVWVIDPLDGTRAFITGRPLFGTLIALLRNGKPYLGVIDMPILGDRWIGISGQPTRLNGEIVTARPCASLGDAYLSTVSRHVFTADEAPLYDKVAEAVKTPTYGGDCYQYAMVATGFIDIVVEAGLGIYDYLALVPVIEGAGGVITDWQGRDLDSNSSGQVVAAGDRRLLDQALSLLQG